MTGEASGRSGVAEWVDHPEMTASRLAGGGFCIDDAAGGRFAFEIDGRIWRGTGPRAERWALERPDARGTRFVLTAAGAAVEAGRTTAFDGLGRPAMLYYLLLGDGRLFRVCLRGPRDGRYELSGWESEGALLVARPAENGWRIIPTLACGGLPDIRAIAILFSAELLESEAALT